MFSYARSVVVSGLIAGLLFSSGCGAGSEAAVEGPVIEIGGTDTMKFEPATIAVKAGEPVTIIFRNRGVIVHDYISQGAERNVKLANVLGGRSGHGVFQASKPGTYAVICQQPGHREAGMVGQIVVE